jgi:ADP-ribose pyrophosphatase YjhB (NUDIX family)
MTSPVVAVGAVVVHDGALLLVRRAAAPGAGKWCTPGGRLEYGERMRAGAAREVLEETGLTVTIGALAGVDELTDVSAGYHFVFVDFFATVVGSPALVAGDDATDARWVPLADVPAYDLVAGLHDFLVTIGTVHA